MINDTYKELITKTLNLQISNFEELVTKNLENFDISVFTKTVREKIDPFINSIKEETATTPKVDFQTAFQNTLPYIEIILKKIHILNEALMDISKNIKDSYDHITREKIKNFSDLIGGIQQALYTACTDFFKKFADHYRTQLTMPFNEKYTETAKAVVSFYEYVQPQINIALSKILATEIKTNLFDGFFSPLTQNLINGQDIDAKDLASNISKAAIFIEYSKKSDQSPSLLSLCYPNGQKNPLDDFANQLDQLANKVDTFSNQHKQTFANLNDLSKLEDYLVDISKIQSALEKLKTIFNNANDNNNKLAISTLSASILKLKQEKANVIFNKFYQWLTSHTTQKTLLEPLQIKENAKKGRISKLDVLKQVVSNPAAAAHGFVDYINESYKANTLSITNIKNYFAQPFAVDEKAFVDILYTMKGVLKAEMDAAKQVPFELSRINILFKKHFAEIFEDGLNNVIAPAFNNNASVEQ